ncbi:hypothetical protein [Clavibacter michiganensis]|uniref:hypothetical protein n=1 Tax=Clavibacter michiganensis TaxID=28447 RepID=UPI000A9D8A05|nr:hypothetical protein [Clavibacter michiganensis]
MSKVKSKLDGIDSLARDVGAHPCAHLEAGDWRIQVEVGSGESARRPEAGRPLLPPRRTWHCPC